MHKFNSHVLSALLLMSMAVCPDVSAAGDPEHGSSESTFSVGVFVPGVIDRSPIYEQMVAGAARAAEEHPGTMVKVVEGGFNQGEWEENLTAMAATMEYDLLLTSNGAMPYVALPVAEAFPDQKSLILDTACEGHQQMHTILYNQVEQAALVGFLAGLVTTSDMIGANQGVIIAAHERGKYMLYFDEDGYDLAPYTIVGSSELMQEKAVYEHVKAAIQGTLEWGIAEVLGVSDGYIDFADDNPLYRDAVPEGIRHRMEQMLSAVWKGDVKLPVPR